MDKQAKIKQLEAEKKRVSAQLNDLKVNRFVKMGKHFGQKLFHTVHETVQDHSFANWKANYAVVERPVLKTLRYERGRAQDAALRANNSRTHLR